MPEDGPLVAKIGTIVKEDPVLRFSKAGKPFTKFSLQVKDWVPGGGEQPEPTYYEVTCFGGTAEHVAECMRKSYRVGVIGIGKLASWTGNDGKEHKTKEIAARFVGPDLQFVTAELHGNERPVSAPTPQPDYHDEPVF